MFTAFVVLCLIVLCSSGLLFFIAIRFLLRQVYRLQLSYENLVLYVEDMDARLFKIEEPASRYYQTLKAANDD